MRSMRVRADEHTLVSSMRTLGNFALIRRRTLVQAMSIAVAAVMSRPVSAQVTRIDMYIGGYLCGN
jgi:hypothetical protein